MRTNVILDEKLITRALKVGGFRTKKSAIEAGLQLLIQMKSQKRLRELRGKIRWEGSLERMRRD